MSLYSYPFNPQYGTVGPWYNMYIFSTSPIHHSFYIVMNKRSLEGPWCNTNINNTYHLEPYRPGRLSSLICKSLQWIIEAWENTLWSSVRNWIKKWCDGYKCLCVLSKVYCTPFLYALNKIDFLCTKLQTKLRLPWLWYLNMYALIIKCVLYILFTPWTPKQLWDRIL